MILSPLHPWAEPGTQPGGQELMIYRFGGNIISPTWTHSCQRTINPFFAALPPSQVMVSGERVAPNHSSRIATLPFLEIGCASGDTLALKLTLLARNRLNSSVSRMNNENEIQ